MAAITQVDSDQASQPVTNYLVNGQVGGGQDLLNDIIGRYQQGCDGP